MNRAPIRVALATASSPGAVAIVQLSGASIAAVLQQLTGVNDWPIGRVRLVNFADIDDGMAVLWREEWAQIMPHGGPRVVRKLLDRLVELGCVYENDPPARRLYPEAASDLEADMLATLARAASPAAIDLLLEQPRLWRDYIAGPSRPGLAFPELISRSDTLDRLITPPCVVVVGRPNVGKSTLTNRMLGRAASIVADLPGTTRDWVAGLAEINGIAVRWLDTPGIRASDDPIERRAIELAADAIRGADVVVAMRDGEIDWPEASSLPRTPDIRVINKIDRSQPGAIDTDAIAISAATGDGVDRLERAVVESFGLSGVVVPELWAFSRGLKRIVDAGDWDSFTRYAGVSSNGK